jgi:hypothetical protein
VADSPGANYNNNRSVSLTSPTLDFTGYTGAQLRFNQICDPEAGFDFCKVEIAPDGVTWQTVASFDGAASAWEPVVIDVPQLAGASNARIRFHLTSDPGVTADGWHVDDIQCAARAPPYRRRHRLDGISDAFDRRSGQSRSARHQRRRLRYACDADLNNDPRPTSPTSAR